MNGAVYLYAFEKSMTIRFSFVSRLWFYFRIGYGTYLTFFLGHLSTVVTVYYLAIKNMRSLLDLFPHFVPFAMVSTLIGVPLAAGIGWVHIKRSTAWSSELDISQEANPYNYRLQPGYLRETLIPFCLELMILVRRLAEEQKLLTDEEKSRIETLEKMLQTLISGGSIGTPGRSRI